MLTLLKPPNIKIKYFYELNFTHRRPPFAPNLPQKKWPPPMGQPRSFIA